MSLIKDKIDENKSKGKKERKLKYYQNRKNIYWKISFIAKKKLVIIFSVKIKIKQKNRISKIGKNYNF